MWRDVGYLDWTIDGVPLREVLAWPNGTVAKEVALLQNDRAPAQYRIDYLRALLGGAVRSEQAVMPDGRVPILVCPVDFGLGRRALTAPIAFGEDAVQWRDIAWQSDIEPLELAEQELAAVSVTFDRAQYECLVRGAARGRNGLTERRHPRVLLAGVTRVTPSRRRAAAGAGCHPHPFPSGRPRTCSRL